MSEKYISFSLAKEKYCVPLLLIKEVVKMQIITPVPQLPNYYLGVFNLRGQVITALDLRRKLGLTDLMSEEKTIMIINLNEGAFGVLVDGIDEVISISEKEIQENSFSKNKLIENSILGVYKKNDELILLLDVFKALALDNLNHNKQAA